MPAAMHATPRGAQQGGAAQGTPAAKEAYAMGGMGSIIGILVVILAIIAGVFAGIWSLFGMVNALTLFFVIVSLMLLLVVLIQKPKGGGLSGAFGGAGGGADVVFGSKTGDVLTWVTVGLFVAFLGLAMGLTWAGRPSATTPDGATVTPASGSPTPPRGPGGTAPPALPEAMLLDDDFPTPAFPSKSPSSDNSTPPAPVTPTPAPPSPGPAPTPPATDATPTPTPPAPATPATDASKTPDN